ncbi:glycosyltransferase [Leuconostoc gasicomitatum]|uniref:glycosyltransferase n=1 Tax=Leuconostoc gasicomitatum TaxID=115778 RepID=UPI0007448E28|nr:glycosyltransferase family 2 protein [Leuconostoc gasicomitatum]CUR63284.1 Glycosyl transferase EpsF [Leuconostoc gasicomitatum KG16-1]
MKPKLVISIVLYNNQSSQIKRLLTEFISFSNKNYDICESKLVLTDNYSTSQDTISYLKQIDENKIENIKIITLQENRGFGGGHNVAFKMIASNYFFVLNPDIIGLSNIDIESSVNYLKEHQEVGMLVPKLYDPDSKLQLTNKLQSTVFDQFIRLLGSNFFRSRQRKFNQADSHSAYNQVNVINNAQGAAMLFVSDIYQKIDGFDEKYFLYMEDADITMKVNRVARSIYFPDMVLIHEWQQNNRSIKGVKIMIQSMFIYYRKWGWKLW